MVEAGIVEVKASHGDTLLGGDDFDDLLVQHAVKECLREHQVDLSADRRALRRLKMVLEQAKCRLSDEPLVRVREEYLDGSHHLELELQREEYERMIERLLEKTLDCIHQSMQDAKWVPADLDKVMLVGGSTRTPLVHQLLTERLALEPRRRRIQFTTGGVGTERQGWDRQIGTFFRQDPGEQRRHLFHHGSAGQREVRAWTAGSSLGY